MPKPAKLALALTVGTLVLLEVVLQVAYLGFWLWSPRHATDSTADQRVVMCVGDSYTYGVGASARGFSYPAQLEVILRERAGPEWRVINAAWPGKNSRQILELIDGYLAEYRPELLYLLVGLNDTWSLPKELILPDAPPPRAPQPQPSLDAYRLEWRTGKLISIFRSMLTGPADAASPGDPIATDPAEPASEPDSPWRAFSRGDFATAEKMYRDKLRDVEPDSDRAASHHRGLAGVYSRWGKAEELEAELAWLRQAYAAQPRRAVGLSLLGGLEKAGNDEETREMARELCETFPDSAYALRCYAFLSYQVGDVETAERVIEKAIETEEGRTDPWVWRNRAAIYGRSDVALSIESAIRAYLLDGDEKAIRVFRKQKSFLDDEAFMKLVADLVSDPDQRAFLERMWTGEESAVQRDAAGVYGSHLRQLIRRCQRAGARLVLATYPSGAHYLETNRRIAKETGVRLLEIHADFERALAEKPELQLFVSDRHCNDAGYRMMAEIAAEDALAHARAPRAASQPEPEGPERR